MEQTELFPGVSLTYIQSRQFKTDYVSLNILRPLLEDEAPLGALLPSVLLRGTRTLPDMQAICACLDNLYGAGIEAISRKKGEVQLLGFYMDFIDNCYVPDGSDILSDALRFLGQLLLDPLLDSDGLLPDAFVQSEKENLIRAIEAQYNDKQAWANQKLVEHMFRGEAYRVSRLGTAEQVRAITAEALTDYWRCILAESEITLFYLGQTPFEQVRDVLCTALAGLPRAERLTSCGTELCLPDRPVEELSETADVTQGKLAMGFRTPDVGGTAQFPALVLCNAIFGGGITSKLFENVREKRHLCYYASSGLERFKGVMVVRAGIDTDQYETVRDAILQELADCAAGRITAEELDTAKQTLLSSLRSASDSPGRLDERHLTNLLEGSDESLEEYAAQLQAVTIEEIAAAAGRLRLDTIYFVKGAAEHA